MNTKGAAPFDFIAISPRALKKDLFHGNSSGQDNLCPTKI